MHAFKNDSQVYYCCSEGIKENLIEGNTLHCTKTTQNEKQKSPMETTLIFTFKNNLK